MNGVCVANNQFNFELFRAVTKSTPENIFMSSFSIMSALAMAHLGAKGETASQMEQTLHLKASKNFDADFKALMSDMNSSQKNYTLKMANKPFGEKTITFLQSFLYSAQSYYDAALETVDFQTAPEEARQYINNWAKEQTEGKIIDLLKKNSVASDTKLVLVNAMYFKSVWQSVFDPDSTREETFKLTKTFITTTQMMSQKGHFNVGYVEEQKLQILELPYTKGEMSMFILLPEDIADSTNGLQQLESNISSSTLEEWIQSANMQMKYVQVKMPRFDIRSSLNLKDVLQTLGMTDAFSESKANFTGMTEQSNLYMSQVAHATFVHVNETGTEASAATGIVMTPTATMEPEVTFTMDHPFLFFIKHKNSGCILFWGKLNRP